MIISKAYVDSKSDKQGKLLYRNYQSKFSTLRTAAEKLCINECACVRGDGCTIGYVKRFSARYICHSIDPFLDTCTIAGVYNKVFRSRFLQENAMGILPRKI